MTVIVRYTHMDQQCRVYSYPIYFGSYWNAKRRFGFWRFDVYIGSIKGTTTRATDGEGA